MKKNFLILTIIIFSLLTFDANSDGGYQKLCPPKGFILQTIKIYETIIKDCTYTYEMVEEADGFCGSKWKYQKTKDCN